MSPRLFICSNDALSSWHINIESGRGLDPNLDYLPLPRWLRLAGFLLLRPRPTTAINVPIIPSRSQQQHAHVRGWKSTEGRAGLTPGTAARNYRASNLARKCHADGNTYAYCQAGGEFTAKVECNGVG